MGAISDPRESLGKKPAAQDLCKLECYLQRDFLGNTAHFVQGCDMEIRLGCHDHIGNLDGQRSLALDKSQGCAIYRVGLFNFPAISSHRAMLYRFFIDEPTPIGRAAFPGSPLTKLLLRVRAKVVEPILRHILPSRRSGRLKATASMIGRGRHVWIHEGFQCNQDDFATLFQAFFGATFTERDFRFREVTMFSHVHGRVWLTTHLSFTDAPTFRILWQSAKLPIPDVTAMAFGQVDEIVHVRMPALRNIDSAFGDALNGLAAFSRCHVYRAPEGEKLRLPQLDAKHLRATAVVRVLRTVSHSGLEPRARLAPSLMH